MQGFKRVIRSFRSPGWSKQAEMAEQRQLEGLTFDNDEDKFLFSQARVGVVAMEFWQSEVGVYLREQIAKGVRESTNKLATVSPLDHEAIAEAQVTVRAGQLLTRIITEAIQGGEEAELEMIKREEYEKYDHE
jgi:hypothetical protein